MIVDKLISAVRRNPAVIIDMTATTFCDCAGARAIVQVHFRDLVMRDDSAVLTLRWEATGPGGRLFRPWMLTSR